MKNETGFLKQIKTHFMLAVVVVGILIIAGSGFIISYKSIVEVGILIGISVPELFPVLFEATSIIGAIGKGYVQTKGIKGKGVNRLASSLLYIGAGMSVLMNVFGAEGRIAEAGFWSITGFITILGHSLPSIVVVLSIELFIYLLKSTFTKGDDMSLTDRIKELSEKLSVAHNDHKDTQHALAQEKQDKTKLTEEIKQLSSQVAKFDNIPPLLKAFIEYHHEEITPEEIHELFGVSKHRITGLFNEPAMQVSK